MSRLGGLWRAGAVGVCLLCAARAWTGESSVAFPGLPARETLYAALDPQGPRHGHNALAAWLYFVPAHDLTFYEELYLNNSKNARPGDGNLFWPLLARGSPTVVAQFARWVAAGNTELAQQARYRLRPDEFKKIGPALEDALQSASAPAMGAAWLHVAAVAGDPKLLARALKWLDAEGLANNSRTANEFHGQFDADACAAAFTSAVCDGPTPRRLRILGLLQHGWRHGPPDGWLKLAADPDDGIRTAFLDTLSLSTSARALTLLEEFLANPNQNLRIRAANALVSFKGPIPFQTLQKYALAAPKTWPASVPAFAWRRLAEMEGNTLISAAQSLFCNPNGELPARTAAGQYLIARKELAWMTSRLPTLDGQVCAQVLTELVAARPPDLAQKLPPLVVRLDPPLVRQVVQSIGGQRYGEKGAPPWDVYIELLRDKRPEVVGIVEEALSTATGVKPGGGRGGAADAYARWSAWYKDYGQPPNPALQERLDEVRNILDICRNAGDEDLTLNLARLDYDPLPILRRLCFNPKEEWVLYVFCRWSDPRVPAVIMEMFANPVSANQRFILAHAISEHPSDPLIVAGMLKALDDAEQRADAAMVLARWRVESAAGRLADELLEKGLERYDRQAGWVFKELTAWKHPRVLQRARELATKGAPEVSRRALRFMIATRQEGDAPFLAQQAGKPGPAQALAAGGLAQLAVAGVAGAEEELAKLLARSDQQVTSLILAEVLRVLHEPLPRPPDARGPAEYPEGLAALCEPARKILASSNAPDDVRRRACAVLAAAGDQPGVALLRNYAHSLKNDALPALLNELSYLPQPEARPYLDVLAGLPDLDAQARQVIGAWYKQVLHWSEAALDDLLAKNTAAVSKNEQNQPVSNAQLSKKDERDKPVSPLELSLSLGMGTLGFSQPFPEITLTLKNRGPINLTLPASLPLNLFTRTESAQGASTKVELVLAEHAEQATLSPGQSVTRKFKCDALRASLQPGTLNHVCAAQSLRLSVTPPLILRGETDLMFGTDVLLEVDQRYRKIYERSKQ